MTVEKRFQRIEHITAGEAEERRKDREEYRMLWRDTQRERKSLAARVGDLTCKIADTNEKIADTNDTTMPQDEELRDEKDALGKRIDALVSAIGEFLRKQDGSPQ